MPSAAATVVPSNRRGIVVEGLAIWPGAIFVDHDGLLATCKTRERFCRRNAVKESYTSARKRPIFFRPLRVPPGRATTVPSFPASFRALLIIASKESSRTAPAAYPLLHVRPMRVLEARFHPQRKGRPDVVTVGYLVWRSGSGERPEFEAAGGKVSAPMLSKLRYLIEITRPDSYVSLQSLRSQFWSFVEVGPEAILGPPRRRLVRA